MDTRSFRYEFSAGGIVIKKEQEKTFVLVVQHSGHKGWGFPKGHIENGEKKEDAALREVKEEGGVQTEILKEVGANEYYFVQDNVKIKKRVYYFLMKYISGDINNHDWEMMATQWLPLGEVKDRLTYKGDKEVFEQVEKDIATF